MFLKPYKSHQFGKLHVFIALFMVTTVVMGTLPGNIAQADADSNPVQTKKSFRNWSSDTFDGVPERTGSPPVSYSSPIQTQPSYAKPPLNEEDPINSDRGMEVGDDGILPLPTSASGGSLPAGFDARGLFSGISVDLSYDVVMGRLTGRDGEMVTVTMGADGYGAAVVDDTGFFWTPVWHTTDGYPMDLACGMTISVVVGSDPAVVIDPPCITGGIDLSTNTLHGQVAGDPGGNYIYPQKGYFDPELMEPRPVTGAFGSSTVTTEADGFGSFTYNLLYDFGAESLYTLDYKVDDGIYVRTYFYPDTPVFMVQQYNSIGGYADVGQTVTASVIDMNTVTVVWSDTTIADWPHGFYDFRDVPIEVGNSVEVALDGGPTLQTFAVALGNLVFDATADTLAGTAPDGIAVRATLWKWSSNFHTRWTHNVFATSGDTFTMDFSSAPWGPIDIRPRDNVLVVAEDPSGNQVQILSGPPFVSANISMDSNIDCVYGRLDGPDLPIVLSLDKGAGEVYTRDTGSFTDVGNNILPPLWCYVIQDGENNLVDFTPGDIVTLKDGTPGWEGSVEVVDFTWSGDTTNNYVNGTTADGDLEVTLSQWHGDAFPINGASTAQCPVSGGSFSRQFVVMDVRDGVMIDFAHYDPVTGFSTDTNLFSYRPTMPYFELNLPFGVGGMAGSPGEIVTARLYDGATLLAETSDDWDDDPYRYWLDDFGGHSLTRDTGWRSAPLVVGQGKWSSRPSPLKEMLIPTC